MPPKKNKSKNGKKGKKGKKGNSKQKIVLTPKEEILFYQLQIKEEYLINLKFELEKIKEDNEKISQRLLLFHKDKEDFGNEMIKKYHELLANTSSKVLYRKSDVIDRMKSNWALSRDEQSEIFELQRKLEMKESNIKDLENKLLSLKYIRHNESDENNQQIKILKQIIDDMEHNFSAITTYLERNYHEKKAELVKNEKLSTEKFQQTACKKASKVIKGDMKQEFADNKWLICKRNVHKENFEALKAEIEVIEKENIELNEKIFQLKQSDRKFANLFLTEIEPHEILFNEGILEYNIDQIFKVNDANNKRCPHFDSDKTDNNIRKIQRNSELSYSSWKDYLNLNPVNFDFMYISGNLLNINESEPKTEEEILEETFRIKTLPVNIQSFNDNVTT